MPSTMIHLLVAYKLNPAAPGPFWLGSFAPDAADTRPGFTREEKDAMHLRVEGRWELLRALALSIGPDDFFTEGCLLHLFTDACWDIGPLQSFALSNTSPDWFSQYRREISLAGCWIYHHSPWMKPVWEAVMASPALPFAPPTGPTAQEVDAYRNRVFIWHQANSIGPSEVYTPEYVEAFAEETAERYRQWRQEEIIT